MSDKTKKTEVLEDYETKPVPESEQMRWFSQGMVWAGSAFCLVAFSVGGMLASGMSIGNFVLAVLLGSAILCAIASAIGVIGANTHLASAFTSRFTLGTGGSKIFGLIIALSLFGWFGYQCSYFGLSAVATLEMFNINAGSVALWSVIGGIAMMITAVVGYKGIKYLSNFGVPCLFALVFIAAIITAIKVPGSDLAAASAAAAGQMSIPAAITAVVGSFISGACTIPDFSRFSKYPKDATFGCVLGFMISFPIILLLGGFFFYAYSTADLTSIFIVQCGLGVFAAFVLIVSTWTTNDNNLYSSVLGITNALGDKVKLPRWALTVVVGLVSTVLGTLGIMDHLTSFLNILGVCIPPVAAAIICDYYGYNKNTGLYSYENVKKVPMFRLNTCGAAVFGIVVGLLCNYTGIFAAVLAFLPACIVAMIAAALALVSINAITGKGKFTC